jgi:uridine kinase
MSLLSDVVYHISIKLNSSPAQWKRVLFRSPFFWIISAVKLFAALYFASDYLTTLFVPFLDSFVNNPGGNPYNLFWMHGEIKSFPYPAFMLYTLAFPRFLLKIIGFPHLGIHAEIFIYRLPLFFADMGILLILCRWLREKTRLITYLYWGSPVLLYITYFHGQLDVLPVGLLFFAIFMLFREKLLLSAFILGLGISTKTNLLIVIPFLAVYLWQNINSLRAIIKYISVCLFMFVLINLPFLLSAGFQKIVLLNTEQNKIASAQLMFGAGHEAFYVIPAILIVLGALALQIRIHNRDVFLTFIGFSLGVFVLFIPPMQGWYYWVLPFFIYFFVQLRPGYLSLVFFLQLSYLLYFGLRPDSDFLILTKLNESSALAAPTFYRILLGAGWNSTIFVDCSFTMLQTFLLLCCVAVYYRGIFLPQRFKLSSRPFLLGISGDSGSGKSTLSGTLRQLFTPRNLEVICGDDMHKWQRGHSRWKMFTHLDPRANELHDELVYLHAIRQNRTIWRRHYDHNTGNFTKELPIKPRPVMVWEGLHTFYLKPSRELFDLKVFLKPDHDLMTHRKVIRDMKNRNYSKEEVLGSIARRKEDSAKYITAQERYADIIVSFSSRSPISNIGDPTLMVKEWLQIKLSNSFFLDPLIEDLSTMLEGNIYHHFESDDWQTLELKATLSAEQIAELGERHVHGLREWGLYNPEWEDGWTGLLQLLLSYCIFCSWKENTYV